MPGRLPSVSAAAVRGPLVKSRRAAADIRAPNTNGAEKTSHDLNLVCDLNLERSA